MSETLQPARVTIEESGLGEKPWAVIITRPGETIPRTLWERYASQREAITGADAARAYLRDKVREPDACIHCGGDLTTGPTGFVDCMTCNPPLGMP